MIILELTVRVEDDERELFLDVLNSLPDRIRAEPGCVNCQVSQDLEHSDQFSIVMKWVDRQALTTHQQGTNYSHLMFAIGRLRGNPRAAMTVGADEVEPKPTERDLAVGSDTD